MMRPQRGYTIIEIIVAVTVLSLGSAVLWYSIRSSARLEKLNRLHQDAGTLARSDLEGLRSVARQDIRDTSYRVRATGGEELMVVREVFDSARMVSSLAELTLDDRMSPLELKKPLEVRVRVYQSAEPGGILPDPMRDWSAGPDGADERRRTLSSLVLKIPEYRWH